MTKSLKGLFNELPEGTKIVFAIWCSGCSGEEATDSIDVEINGEWIPLDIGPRCLTRLKEEGRMEL